MPLVEIGARGDGSPGKEKSMNAATLKLAGNFGTTKKYTRI